MTFYTFMQRSYGSQRSPEGDLAEDMKLDKERFPKNGRGKYPGWYKLIRSHLMQYGTCEMDVFDRCWEEYVKCEKNR